jgi:protein arginine kinase activator
MLCDICHKNIATIHLTEIVNERVVEMHTCQNCARSKAQELDEQFSISDFVGGLAGIGEAKKKEQALKCSSCALSYSEFKKKGRLGCANCYVAFRQQLLPLLKKIHSATRHTGKIPLNLEKKVIAVSRLNDLHEQLARAIKIEEYEEAARLRDEIKKLGKK